MMMESVKKGDKLFEAARALRETWSEVDRLVALIDQKLTEQLRETGRYVPMRDEKSDQDPDDAPDVRWTYQYNFKIRERQRGRPKLAMHLDYEFRVSWDQETSIVRPDGSPLRVPIIVVKGSSAGSIDTGVPFASPTERGTDLEYRVIDRLAWFFENSHIYWSYAVQLMPIESDQEVKSDLVTPIQTLLTATDATIEKLEPVAFKDARHVLHWIDDAGRLLLAGGT
jgi:hypothetical protein